MAFLTRYLYRAMLWLVLSASANAAETLQLHEQEIKAGLLYNFLKYTDWPPAGMEKSSSITVCIFGGDPFEGYLEPMAGRTVNQREIALRTIHKIEDAGACHLLFVNAGEKERWPQLLESLQGKPVLTVSDGGGFADAGGAIEFGRKDNHISVNLNMEAVMAARLHVQDRLLKLVTVVHPAAREGGR